MRQSLTVIALTCAAVLSGCNTSTPDAAAEPSEAVTTAGADSAAAALPVGTWEIVDPSGKVIGTNTVMADGSYARDLANRTREAGIVKMVDGKTCFDPSGKAEPECFTDAPPAPDGSFSTTDAKGNKLTIRPKT